jgi:hypothetical protein
MADDLGREPIPGVARASGCPHPTRLLTPICSRKRGKARQVDGALRCQSGAAAFGPFLMRAVESGIGFRYIISTGNENKQSRVSATPSLESFKSRRQHARQVVGTRLPFWKAMSAISAEANDNWHIGVAFIPGKECHPARDRVV